MRVLAVVIIVTTLIFTGRFATADQHPDEKTFLKDRFECYSKELDYRFIYAHRGINDEEGILVHERPSMGVQLIEYGHKADGWGNTKYYLITNYIAKKFTPDNDDFVREVGNFVGKYFPENLRRRFAPILKHCKVNQR